MKIINAILDFIYAIRKANYAATLARNGKIKQAQNYFGKTVGL